MLVVGLQGSPRKNGNTHFLLQTFMQAARRKGAQTQLIEVCEKNIVPCKEYIVCEKKGFCPIDDDMKHEIYSQLRYADVVVAATPVFFYGPTAQLKALIDRCQTLWARQYKLRLQDPKQQFRQGFMLSVAATRGKNLFEGVELTVKYFFDALAAKYAGSLTYRSIEHKKDMSKHPDMPQQVEQAVDQLLDPLLKRKRIVFASRDDAGPSQMAAALALHLAGGRLEAVSGGTHPAEEIQESAAATMAEKKIDLKFLRPQPLEQVLAQRPPELIINMGTADEPWSGLPAQVRHWKLPETMPASMADWRALRDDLEVKVVELTQYI